MGNKIIKRCLIGMPIGLAISTVITIVISVFIGDGAYYAVVPELSAECGSEIRAVVLQALCSLLYGAAFAGASVIWETEWSLTKMTAVHLLICSAATFPIAWLMYWMDHTLSGVLQYFGIFLVIYILIWISQYFSIKRKIAEMNSRISQS